MMKEIKFRAWNSDTKTMEYDVPVRNNHVLAVVRGYVEGHYVTKTPMQYAGVKDKNGIEIYEGDVLDVEDNHDDAFGDFCAEVKFLNGSFVASEVDRFIPLVFLFHKDFDFEVIGNKFENPELLEGQSCT